MLQGPHSHIVVLNERLVIGVMVGCELGTLGVAHVGAETF